MDLFKDIAARYPQAGIQGICRKLDAYFSFNSGKHLELLCKLAYQMYVLGDTETAKKISCFTHDALFPGKGYFRVWSFILYIWGLEVYILKQEHDDVSAQRRIDAIDGIYHYPLPDVYQSIEQQKRSEQIRRGNFHYPDILSQKDISAAISTASANSWRLSSLYHMIGYTFTGLYPDLLLHQEEIQRAVDEYVAELKAYYTKKARKN